MSDCSKHKKSVAGIEDMKQLAEMIGDLHYETLGKLLTALHDKLHEDGKKDFRKGRTLLSSTLFEASSYIIRASFEIESAYEISKQFMNKKQST